MAFQKWIEEIDEGVETLLVPALEKAGLTLAPERYDACNLEPGHRLATIPDVDSLIAKSQEHHTPVFALTHEQLGGVGVVLKQDQGTRDRFRQMFKALADRVLCLMDDEEGTWPIRRQHRPHPRPRRSVSGPRGSIGHTPGPFGPATHRDRHDGLSRGLLVSLAFVENVVRTMHKLVA